MKLKKFSSSAVAVLTIALGGVALNVLSATTPLTQSAQAATYFPNCPFSAKIYQPTKIRPNPNTYTREIGVLSPNQTVAFSTFENGQEIRDETTKKLDPLWFKLSDGRGYVASAVVQGYPPTSPCPQSTWKMPWRAGIQPGVNGSWHYDFYTNGNNAIDVGLGAGTAVLAPISSTVTSFCKTGDNHLAMKLRASDGKIYTLAHVKATGMFNGKTYRQGEQIGVIAADKPWNDCAKSTNPHLHFGLPNQNMTIDGQRFSPSYIPRPLKSTNQ